MWRGKIANGSSAPRVRNEATNGAQRRRNRTTSRSGRGTKTAAIGATAEVSGTDVRGLRNAATVNATSCASNGAPSLQRPVRIS